jgi:ABC-type branched-subunit amino acid transport system permease subunit
VPPSIFSARVRALGYGGAFVVALLIPAFATEELPGYNLALTQVVLFASLHLLVRSSGQISLCHFGFAAVGAATFGQMLEKDVPFYLAVVLGGLACLPLALIVSIPAVRLSGLYLALATLGFGIVLGQFAYAKSWMFGGGQLLTERAPGLDTDREYYYLLLGVAISSVLFVLAVEQSRLGRLLRAMADSPIALSTLGASVNVSRVIVFCISCFLAGVSGALYASLFGAVTQDAFNFVQSLVVLAVLAIAGRRTVTAAFVAPFLLYVIPVYIDDPKTSQWLQLAFGIGAMFVAAASQGGIAKWLAGQSVVLADREIGPSGERRRAAASGEPPPQWSVLEPPLAGSLR